jgi:hypothetical protein
MAQDVCDHNVLRNDLVMQTAVGHTEPMASAPTLSRLETAVTPAQAVALHEVLLQQFIAGHAKPPQELLLDADTTHVLLHGHPALRALRCHKSSRGEQRGCSSALRRTRSPQQSIDFAFFLVPAA